MKKYKNIEDKPTYLLFWETILRPILKWVSIISVSIFRTIRDFVWFSAGYMLMNSYLDYKLILPQTFWIISIIGLLIYNFTVVRRTMRYR